MAALRGRGAAAWVPLGLALLLLLLLGPRLLGAEQRREDHIFDVWSSLQSYLLSLWNSRLYIYCTIAVAVGIWAAIEFLSKRHKKQNEDVKSSIVKQEVIENGHIVHEEKGVHVVGVKIFFGSQTGTAKGFANTLLDAVKLLGLPVEVVDLKEYDPDDNLVDEIVSKTVCVFLLATYTDGKPTESAAWFCKWLEEATNDFRYGKNYLKGLRYAVFGLGNSAYVGHYNTVGKHVDKWLWMLSAGRVLTRGEGDGNVVKSKRGSLEADFSAWQVKLLSRLEALGQGDRKECSGNCKNGKCKSKGKKHKDESRQKEAVPNERLEHSEEEELFETSSEEGSGSDSETGARSVVDVEDLGKVMNSMKRAKRALEMGAEAVKPKLSKHVNGKSGSVEAREMLTPALRAALIKQGYRLIGSHSGVKLCRWTKSMLRGRGGCYKHTFYGIESHRCMETTPSLACANKCVFCWRHHTNPVGTEWRWKMDEAEQILKEAIENHQNMIKQFKGVPGVKAERFEEGLAVKHCALSLVGEPIMYPQINHFLKLLHQQRISSFLVTNAQFPEEIRNLVPVTQLYVSVDASTQDSLKKIDRPLFKDFWPRFLACLQGLADKKQRTVYRLTLVKAWNVDELKAYSDLIDVGKPDFIEVKGVTYCGDSSASSLTMANVPWHQEVVHFVQQLADLLTDYEIACEHEHSNCLLIAHRKFKVNGEWWTWIDYERFQDLIAGYEESAGARTFSSEDYMAKTPLWALFGAKERGFDPTDVRFLRRKQKDISGC
ncbi:S-adenosyl-L-methionine-dependent tRNA 4-demethylwyosine synthase TYW1 isoform X1 [Callorhinchus milii]|uniref:S-adenosyl-L-methionine-dependent tRNA 4-demethylwyosine synthase TYW1 isoform X1 n=1 Tax=Callorhinchus milii TaxID=7868 RepID=UPI001C3FBDA7|nr:S-adenosyl-L-methionine-dependent tRNA 4-demethylwyosine synthase TYW1 isoform X1 [Callorhinchus milii]